MFFAFVVIYSAGLRNCIIFVLMHGTKYISSIQNLQVKKVLLLKEKSRERRKTNRFVIDGLRELELAVKANYVIETVFFEPDLISQSSLFEIFESSVSTPEFICVSREVYKKMAYRETTEGVLSIAHCKTHDLEKLKLSSKPLLLVAEAPEKPGNIGALLRTADAARIDAFIIANPKTDVYNPNIIRSSVGGVFTTTIGIGTTAEIIEFLKTNQIKRYCAAFSAATNYLEIDYNTPSAIIVGTEATGLSKDWLKESDQNIIIPMKGELDSLNVSVSAAILIFEAIRQREI